MIINGKWMNEPEILALISQLTADKKRLERQMAEMKTRWETWDASGVTRCGHCKVEYYISDLQVVGDAADLLIIALIAVLT